MALSRDSHKKPTIQKSPESVGSPQPHFSDKAFNDAIFDKGYKSYIERAMRCPCTSTPSGQGESGCLNCYGSGWFFIERTETVLMCTSMSNKSKYEAWSETNMGLVNISSRPQDKLGFMDKITLIELESWFTQVVKLVKPEDVLDTNFAFLVYMPITIFDVYLFKDSLNPLISLKPTVDYTVVDNRIIVTQAQLDAVAPGLTHPRLSLRYTHRPTYHVIDINRDLIKQKAIQNCLPGTAGTGNLANFPLNCIGRRAHYVIDNPNFDGNGLYDNTDYTKVNDYNK